MTLSSSRPRSLVIDTDPGIDDAMALVALLSDPGLDVRAISTVFGNTDPVTGALNALRLTELCGHPPIPVGVGAAKPLMFPVGEAPTRIHGDDGLGNINLPAPERELSAKRGPQLLVDTVMAGLDPMTLLTLGPLTNAALALSLEPDLASRLDEIVVMGGSINGGNITPVAEANFFHDPHAAVIVLGADCPVVVVGLNATHQVHMSSDWLAANRALGEKAEVVWRSSRHYQTFFDETGTNAARGIIHPHDLVAAAYIAIPEAFELSRYDASVVLSGPARGQLIAGDYAVLPDDIGRRVELRVATAVDQDTVLDMFATALG